MQIASEYEKGRVGEDNEGQLPAGVEGDSERNDNVDGLLQGHPQLRAHSAFDLRRRRGRRRRRRRIRRKRRGRERFPIRSLGHKDTITLVHKNIRTLGH